MKEVNLVMRNNIYINLLQKFLMVPAMALFVIMSGLGCSNPIIQSQDQGNVRLFLGSSSTRTMESDISTQISLFQVLFTDINGNEVPVESSDSVIDVSLPSQGTWNIEVSGYNDIGILIAYGQQSVALDSTSQQSVTINLLPASGEGTAVLELQWNPIQVKNAAVTGSLIDTSGNTTPLSFSLTGTGSAECASPVEAGYYTLQAQLMDDSTVVAGLAEAVQVLSSGLSQELFIFDSVNKPGDKITITSPDFTVAWDPAVDEETGAPAAVSGYRFYYRAHGSVGWVHLGDTAADTSEYLVSEAALPRGDYDFAVSSLYTDSESELHTSYDDTADPTYGWYISWQ